MHGLRWWTAIVAILGACASAQAPDETAPTPPVLRQPTSPLDPELAPVRSQSGGPPYPIVMVHGFGWAAKIPFDYFWGVKPVLTADGHDVWIAQIPPIGNSVVRGTVLSDFVKDVLQKTGKNKVNLLSHSQGGIDARYAAKLLPQSIASIVTIGTPHRGTPIANFVDWAPLVATQVADWFAWYVLGDADGASPDFQACIDQLSPKGMALFNASVFDPPGVRIYSIAGRTGWRNSNSLCDVPGRPDFVTAHDGEEDIRGALLLPSGLGLDFYGPNDGMVPVESSIWGRFLGCVPADHFDQIGQVGGVSSFDYLSLYRNVAKFIVAEGF